MRHGKGEMNWPSGLKYIGNYRRDRRDGVVGKLLFLNGDSYDGEWVDELMHGKGTYKTTDGRVYRGKFAYGEFGGEGALVFPNSERYEGEVKKMLPEGLGKYYYRNGD